MADGITRRQPRPRNLCLVAQCQLLVDAVDCGAETNCLEASRWRPEPRPQCSDKFGHTALLNEAAVDEVFQSLCESQDIRCRDCWLCHRQTRRFRNPAMSSGAAALDIVDAATANVPALDIETKNHALTSKAESVSSLKDGLVGPNGEQYPSEEDWTTLRRVYGKVDLMIYIIGIVEMCERFAYYGTTAVCKQYWLQDRVLSLTVSSRQLHSKATPRRGSFPQRGCWRYLWTAWGARYSTLR